MLLEAMKGRHCYIDKLYLRSTQLTEKAMNALQLALAAGDLTFQEIGLTGCEEAWNSSLDNPIGSQGFNALAEGLIQAQVHLQKLWLFGNDDVNVSDVETDLDDAIAPSFTQLIAEGLLDELVLLDIAGNNINEVTLSQICSAVIDTAIPLSFQELWIGGCEIGDDGVMMLASLIRNGFLPCLSTLSIDSINR